MKSQSQMIFLLFIGYVFVYIDKTVTGFALLPIEKNLASTPNSWATSPVSFSSPTPCSRSRRAG